MRIVTTACLIVVATASASHACSCSPWPPPLDAMKDATAVFSGRVVNADPVGESMGFDFKVEVYAVWKGPVSETLAVSTEDVAMCGLYLQPGEEYLVYAYGEADALTTNNCSRSRMLDLAAEDLEQLGSAAIVPVASSTMTMLKDRYE